jgi:class 3 adenylate cyclase
MDELPESTVSFLFTDVEGSTRLWQEQPQAMAAAVALHERLLGEAIAACGGQVFKRVGDAMCAAFPTARMALEAAVEGQRRLLEADWGDGPVLRVRVAVHTGEAEARDGDYYGLALSRVARVLAAGHGGQILLSQVAYDLVRDDLPAGVTLADLGSHRLKDLQRPECIFQVEHPALPTDFPPLRTLEAHPHNLPVQRTSFVGREGELAEIKRLLDTTHLLTLTGSGGCGKTRLALQAAAEVVEDYRDGVWLVELATLSDPALVPQRLAAALHLTPSPQQDPLDSVRVYLRDKSLLLVVDNCEHVVENAAAVVDALLGASPGLRIIATSRMPLRVAGEQSLRVPSLSLPPRGPRGDGGLPVAVRRGAVVHRSRLGGPTDLPGHQRERPGPGAALLPPGRHSSRRGVGGGPIERPVGGPDRRPPGRPLPLADQRQPRGPPPAANTKGTGGLELRPAQRK